MTVREYVMDSLFLPDSYGARRRSTEFDYITPQAFGRGSYPEYGCWLRLQRWIQSARGGAISPDVGFVRLIRDRAKSDVEAFEELSAKFFDPGIVNCELAEICARPFLRKEALPPIIGDWEVMYALWRLYPDWYARYSDFFTVIWPPQEGYFATHGMLLEVKRIADEKGLSEPRIVAHPEHIQRVYFLARKIFGKTISTKTLRQSLFDPKSVQWWTRGRWRWLAYEMLARLHHRIHGWF